MAFTLGDLGNGSGYIYEQRASGAIETLPNTKEAEGSLKLRGVRSRKTAVPDFIANGYDTNFYTTSRFYLNAEPTAPVNSIVGAVEITDDIIVPTFSVLDTKTIASDVLTIERQSNFTVIALNPESGNADVLNEITYTDRPFIPGDFLILFANGVGDSISVNDDDVAAGNIKLAYDRNSLLVGKNSLLLVKDGTGWREVCRTIDSTNSYAQKTIVAGGGTWNVLDSAGGNAYLATRDGVAVAHIPSTVTLTSDQTIQAEGTITTRSEGQHVTVIPDGSIILNGRSLTVFGIDIPRYLALAGAWKVDAWYNGTDYTAVLTQTLTAEAWSDFTGLGTITTNNSGVLGDILYLRKVDVMDGNGVIHLAGTVTLKVDYSVGGVPLDMVSNISSTVLPEENQKMICDVNDGEKICMVLVDKAGARIWVYEITGHTLLTGDVVDLSGFKYAAAL